MTVVLPVTVTDTVVEQRRDRGVNAALRAADLLVGLAALALAALGFAVSTAVRARQERSDLVVLTALGMPRAQLERVQLGERIAVLVVAAVTGSLAGLVVARVSIGTLVAGDGHVQVPPVRMVLAGWPVAGGVVALVLVLLLVSVPIVRRGVSRVAADLREGGV